MANVDSLYAGKGLNPAYVKERGDNLTLTIANAKIKEFSGQNGTERKVVLSFVGEDRALTLNKTNYKIIRSAWGPETDNWLNKKIQVKTYLTSFGGEPCDSIMVACVTDVAAGTPTNATTTAAIDLPLGAKNAVNLTEKVAALAAKEQSNNFDALRSALSMMNPSKADVIKGPPEHWPRSLMPGIQQWIKEAEDDGIPF